MDEGKVELTEEQRADLERILRAEGPGEVTVTMLREVPVGERVRVSFAREGGFETIPAIVVSVTPEEAVVSHVWGGERIALPSDYPCRPLP